MNNNKVKNIIHIFFLLIFSANFLSAQKKEIKKPNIVLIMVDDMGFSDIGSYGSEIQTPHLDKLASEGIRFREFYNNSICAPTRASLLTVNTSTKLVSDISM